MKQLRVYSAVLAAVLLFGSLIGAMTLVPAQAAVPGPLAAPTPVAAVVRSPSPEFPIFFNGAALAADTRSSCFEVPDYSIVDLQYLVDQTLVASAANTVTLNLQFSNDMITFVDGVAAASDVATDTAGLVQLQLFGRHTCVYANVTNTNPVTITVNGVVK